MIKMNERVVAYHEAGYAVVAWRLRIRVRRASIVPGDDSSGHVLSGMLCSKTVNEMELEADCFSPSRLQAEKRVMVSIAGELAQRRFNPRSFCSYHGSSDLESASLFLERYAACGQDGVIDARTHYKLLREWTAQTIEHNWR